MYYSVILGRVKFCARYRIFISITGMISVNMIVFGEK